MGGGGTQERCVLVPVGTNENYSQIHNRPPRSQAQFLQHPQASFLVSADLCTNSLCCEMEDMVKKFQQKYKQVREQMDNWDQLQAHLLSQFRNASSVMGRLQMIQDRKNYGSLRCVGGIEAAVLQKQMDSLEMIMLSINKTMEQFHEVVRGLDKLVKDGRQLVRGGSQQPSVKQLQQRVGVKPSLNDCIDGLVLLHEMHHSEYQLKMSIVAALPKVVTESREADLSAILQLLGDQPNILREEVELIYDIIFAEKSR